MGQTVFLVREISHTAVQTMFDTHNAVADTVPHDELIQHVHVNEMDGRHPGLCSCGFSVPLRPLKETSFRRWLSAEFFRFESSGGRIAGVSSQHSRDLEAGLVPESWALGIQRAERTDPREVNLGRAGQVSP